MLLLLVFGIFYCTVENLLEGQHLVEVETISRH
jgi:hypothetical protein